MALFGLFVIAGDVWSWDDMITIKTRLTNYPSEPKSQKYRKIPKMPKMAFSEKILRQAAKTDFLDDKKDTLVIKNDPIWSKIPLLGFCHKWVMF